MADEPTEPATGTEPPAPQPPAEPAPPAPEPATGEPEPAQPAATDGSAAEEAAKWKALARKHEEQNKTTRAELAKLQAAQEADRAERAKQTDAIARAFGLKPEEVTPEQIAAERDAAKTQAEQAAAQARRAAIDLAVFRQAASLKADPNALLDSRAFADAVAALDPQAADFGEQVKAAIESAVEANPRYKLDTGPPAPPPKPEPTIPTSGPGQFTGAPSTPRQWTEEDVRHASPAQVQEAINKGLLVNLGFGPKRASRR